LVVVVVGGGWWLLLLVVVVVVAAAAAMPVVVISESNPSFSSWYHHSINNCRYACSSVLQRSCVCCFASFHVPYTVANLRSIFIPSLRNQYEWTLQASEKHCKYTYVLCVR
jgi:hypothetical protein